MFGTVLLLLLIFFVIVPLIKLLWRFWPIISQYRKMSKQMNETYRAAQESQSRQQSYGDTPRRSSTGRKNKIDPTVGEFVNFEEVKDPRPQETSSPRKDIRQEPQVEDAVWEDIK